MYELRDSSWYDRGTGHCKGVYDDTQDLALLIVEAEDLSEGKDEQATEGEGGFLKEELLLSTRVEKDDIYARQQGQSLRDPGRATKSILMSCRNPNSVDGTDNPTRYCIVIPRFRRMRGYLVLRL